jgi:molybdate transport system substrate-binding protein
MKHSTLFHLATTSIVFAAVYGVFVPNPSSGEGVLVAVAANFSAVVEKMEPVFEAETGHDLRILSASTGKLYAQIVNGAPYDILLAADQLSAAKLADSKLAIANSRRTYATGKLVLWSRDPERIVGDGRETLRRADFRRLALANPDLAPYGVAARETLRALGLFDVLRKRLVMGENIGQAYALVATGNAEVGLIAMSQSKSTPAALRGSFWVVPESLYTPIRQDVVLLARARQNPAAIAFLEYLESKAAHELIRESGYSTE